MGAGERILVTGGSGFVGACLVRRLLGEGRDVSLVLRPEAKLWRLAGLEGRYTTLCADLSDAGALKAAVAVCRPAVVYHLATYGAYPFQKDQAAILATNLLGTANLLAALRDHDYRAFINAGSSSEYGHKDRPMREDDVLNPRSDYGVAKAASTLLCQAESHQGRPVTTVRLFSAYGPWEEPTRLVPYVMGCCLRGETPRVTAGRQPRDFIYVDDVIDLLLCAANSSAAHGQVLHAGTGAQHTVEEMIETIVAVCGKGRVRPEYGGVRTRPDEPACWVASIDRTRTLTGWQPRYDLRAGVEQMWTWFQQVGGMAA
jgi:nucleoside-diphosphate-sugar epimerase